jgi:hypothetical protein
MKEGNSVFIFLTGRPRRKREDNIRIDFTEKYDNLRNWIDPAQNRNSWRVLVIAALNLQVP